MAENGGGCLAVAAHLCQQEVRRPPKGPRTPASSGANDGITGPLETPINDYRGAGIAPVGLSQIGDEHRRIRAAPQRESVSVVAPPDFSTEAIFGESTPANRMGRTSDFYRLLGSSAGLLHPAGGPFLQPDHVLIVGRGNPSPCNQRV